MILSVSKVNYPKTLLTVIYADVTTICPTGIGTTVAYIVTGATTSTWYTCFNEKNLLKIDPITFKFYLGC